MTGALIRAGGLQWPTPEGRAYRTVSRGLHHAPRTAENLHAPLANRDPTSPIAPYHRVNACLSPILSTNQSGGGVVGPRITVVDGFTPTFHKITPEGSGGSARRGSYVTSPALADTASGHPFHGALEITRAASEGQSHGAKCLFLLGLQPQVAAYDLLRAATFWRLNSPCIRLRAGAPTGPLQAPYWLQH